MTPEDLIQSLPPLGGVLKDELRNNPTAYSSAALAVARVVVEHVLRELEKQEPAAYGTQNMEGRIVDAFYSQDAMFHVPLYTAPHPRSEE